MPSATEIANLALEKLGDEGEINDLTEDSRAARAVLSCFDAMRDAVLRDHPWSFALHRVQLPALIDAPAWGGWTAFQKPADFIRFADLEHDCDHQIEGDRILARQPGPLNLRYVRRIEDTGRFDPAFVEALACRIAMQVAVKITGSQQAREVAEGAYRRALADAKRANGQERQPEPFEESSWITAREGF